MNQETNKSKGYAFIEFTNYIEFQQALNNPDPIIFGQQKLVFNSAKNRYDYNENILINNKREKEENKTEDIYEIDFNKKYNNNINYFGNNSFFNIRFSGISDGSPNNSFTNSSYISSFKEEKNKSKQIQNTQNNILDDNSNSTHLQIKYALKNLVNCYSTNPYFLKSKLCSYYCSPFL